MKLYTAVGRQFPYGIPALAYNVRAKDEVNQFIQRALDAGVTLLKAARQASWGGYSGYFADPDGFAWEVAKGACPLCESPFAKGQTTRENLRGVAFESAYVRHARGLLVV